MSVLEKEKEAMLITAIFKGNLIELYSVLRNFKINPSKLQDIKGNNALQLSCLNNSYQIVEFLIRFAQEYFPDVSIAN